MASYKVKPEEMSPAEIVEMHSDLLQAECDRDEYRDRLTAAVVRIAELEKGLRAFAWFSTNHIPKEIPSYTNLKLSRENIFAVNIGVDHFRRAEDLFQPVPVAEC